MPRIPILLFPPSQSRRFRFVGRLTKPLLTDSFKEDISVSRLPLDPDLYLIAFVFSSLLWAISLSILVIFLQVVITLQNPIETIPTGALVFIPTFLGFFLLHYAYPSIIARTVADLTDRQLIPVLKDMWIQSSAGVPLYDILNNISRSHYGTISEDIDSAVRAISAGEQQIVVLERVASATRSEEFKRSIWQITSSLRTGGGLTHALENASNMLTANQFRAVREYGASMNFYLLLYLMFAAVIPAIVTTFVSLISVFGVFQITIELLLAIVLGSAIVQFVLVGLMRIGRPEI